MSTRRWALVLAIGATSTALCLSVLSGWQRGGSLPERLIWIAIGLVLVTSAHLLPALLRDVPILVRAMGNVLWGACLATACIGHAVFFVTAQQHAGELRVSAVPAAPVSTSGRSLTAVMTERATVTAQLAVANARYCASNCALLETRRVTIAARVDALNAEADDIRRKQVADDRITARRDALRADPVTSRLATLLGASIARIDLLFAAMFAAVLESVACLLWFLALHPPQAPVPGRAHDPQPDVSHDAVPVTAEVMSGDSPAVSPVTPASSPVTTRHAYVTQAGAVLDGQPSTDLARLVQAVKAGQVRATVADIRRYLGCSQARASTLRRQLANAYAGTTA
ncbi:hypothetical protein [Paraburkholderia sediminicola]|uniref:hypothetical protein n=1 Tax=Paraburkholderia sediminicola TaxID=458836 RepID=UPI0038BBB048